MASNNSNSSTPQYQSKVAGASTMEMAAKRHRLRWLALAVMGLVILALLTIGYSPQLAAGIGGFGLVGMIIALRFVFDSAAGFEKRLHKLERRALRGAKSEEKIGKLLEELGDNFLVLHDVVSPYGNIDHIVLSKTGTVFLIETKAHGGRVSTSNGKILVNEHLPEKDFIAQTLKNTYWLRDQLGQVLSDDPWITPVLVFTNAFVERMSPIKGVTVLNRKFLLDFLHKPQHKMNSSSVWDKRDKIRLELFNGKLEQPRL